MPGFSPVRLGPTPYSRTIREQTDTELSHQICGPFLQQPWETHTEPTTLLPNFPGRLSGNHCQPAEWGLRSVHIRGEERVVTQPVSHPGRLLASKPSTQRACSHPSSQGLQAVLVT